MTTIVISKMTVESYDQWHEAWEASRSVRAASGMQSATVLRAPASAGSLTILTRWPTAAQAKDFIEKQSARIKTHAASGTTPEWSIYEEATTETY